MRKLTTKALAILIIFNFLFSSLPFEYLQSVSAHGRLQETVNEKGKKEYKYEPKRVTEIKEKRTKHSKTWRNSDLSETIELFSSPIHYEIESDSKKEWKEIDNNLTTDIKDEQEKGKFKFVNKENRFKAFFAEHGDKEIFKIKEGKYWISYSIEGANSAVGKAKNNSIVYKDIIDHVDAVYYIRGDGVKEDLVFHEKPATNEILFNINTNLEVRENNQAIEFVDKSENKVIWSFTPPFLRDAEDKESHNVSYKLKNTKGKIQISLQLDQAFFDNKDTKYPVTLDPTVVAGGDINNTFDAYVGEYYSNVNYGGDAELRTGYAPGVYSHRSFIKFGSSLPSLNGGLLTSAVFKAYKYYEPSSVDTTITIHRAYASWSSSTITWNNQPSFGGSYASKLLASGAANGWYSWDVTNLVNYWYDNPSQYHGLVMQASNENTVGSYRKFYSSDYNGGAYAPRLEITYSPKPSAPTGTASGNGTNTGTGYVNLSWTPVPGATGYKVSIFNGKNYEDIDVGNVTSWSTKGKKLWPTPQQVQSHPDPTNETNWISISSGSQVGNGQELPDDPSYLYKATGGNYPNSKNYWFRVKAYNAWGETALSDAFMPTIPDQTSPSKPGKPVLTNALNSQFTFTWSASSDSNSGVKKYLVYIGRSSNQADVVNGREVTSTTFTYPQAGDPPLDPRVNYYFYVKAVDNNGNTSLNSDVGNGIARLPRDASIQFSSIPSPMEASGTYNVQITVKNEGLETWTAAQNFMLGSVNETDPFTTETRLPLSSSDSIGTGQSKTFNLTFNGGRKLGTLNTSWRMLKVGTGWFGDTLSKDVTVVDTNPPEGAIVINNGETFTNSRNVTLTLNAEDNAEGQILQKLQNEDLPFTEYEPYTQTKQWTLSDGNGDKRVSVIFKDAAGNESVPVSATIKLDTNYPTATITSPEELDYLNGTVEIRGSASDSDLKEYVVEYGSGTSPVEWTTIKRGTENVSDGVLATWDTANIPTGKYTVRLAVTDLAGNTTYSQKYVWIDQLNGRLGTETYWGMEATASGFGSSLVNLSNGNLILGFEDASLDGRQLDPSIERTYNSQDEKSGMLGQGWRLSVESNLEVESNGDVLYTDEDGTIHRFTKNEDGSYTAPKGVFKQLTKNTDGQYILTDLTPESISVTYDNSGRIAAISDKNNNTISFRYENGLLAEMTDDVGRKILFKYYPNNLLQEILLYSGNKVVYSYNDEQLLSNVEFFDKDGVSYRQLSYKYDTNKRLVEAVDPNGNVVTYSYNGMRVINVASKHTPREAATGNLRSTVTVNESFTYDLTTKKVSLLTSGSSVSQEMEYVINDQGNLVETTTDPNGLNIKESFVYEDNLLTDIIDGKGYKTSFVYDSRGNLLKKTEPTFQDIEGGTTTPVTTYEYKPGTNLLIKETDPLGRTTSYDYDSKGNRIWMMDSDGFKTTYEYDQYGNLVKETSERGALYGYLPNFSFEDGDTSSLKDWKTSGTWTYDTSSKKSGTRSVKVTGSASIESDYVPIKKGKLPVRGLAWVKTEAVEGTGVTGTLIFYDSNKTKISEQSSTASLTGTSDWKLLHVAASIPENAEYVTYKLTAAMTGGAAYIDDVWMEEANVTEEFHYSQDGLYLEYEVDAYGNVTSFQYDEAGNKIAETNALNQTAHFKYDADRRLVESIDRLGKKTENKYDKNGNLIKVINPLNQVVEYDYDESNRLTLIKHPQVTKVRYEGQTPLPPEVVTITEVFEYNELGQKIAEKDGNGYVSHNVYDKAGRLVKTIDPLQNERRMFYDANDNKYKEEDWAYDTVTNTLYKKGTTFYNYDELNRLISFTDASGNPDAIVEKTKYDAVGNEMKVVSGTGVVTEYQYNRNNESIYSKESSSPPVETWALYDGAGNLAISLDKQGATYNIYDMNDNLLQVVDSEGKKTTYTYNAVGDKLKQVDSTGSETEWQYDDEGQIKKEIVKIVDAEKNETKYQITDYQYDDVGQVHKKTITEQTGDTTVTAKEITYTYDELGRVVKETGITDGKVTETRYYFDNNGNVINTWTYDETITVPIQYDPDGDGYFNSETESTYDANNRLIHESISHTSTATVNRFDDKENMETFQNSLGTTTVLYDNDDRTKEITTPNFDKFTYDYYVDDSLSKVTAPGMTTTFTYNGGSKVATIKGVNNSGTTVIDYAYSYTDTEQIAQITEKGQVKKKYTYTPNGYLETAEANGTKWKYTYDGNGNITKVENVTTGKVKAEYTYTTGNRIKQKKEYNDQTGALIRTTDYTFHPNGSLAKTTTREGTKETVVDYGYNSDDQLVSVRTTVDGSVVKDIVYEYDQDGNRLSKTIGHTHYHYHRDTNGEIFTITKQISGGDETTASFYKDSDGNLLSFRYKDVVYYYQFNVRGDVVALTDAAGNVVATYDYDEWGNVTSITGNQEVAEANPYRYVGKYGVFYDQDTGMYLMGWRDYDPKTGRFIVPDEYEGEEDEPTSLNRYLYADGDPVNNIDPDGHLPKWLQRGWKATKKWAKKGYDFAIGDDIRTLKSPKSKWYHKAGAAASIASNFIPGAGQLKWGVKAVKYGKKMKKSRKFAAASIKKMRKAKLKAKASRARIKPKLRRPVSGDNVGVNLRAKGTGKFSKYDVGLYKEIKGVPGLDAHHVGQKAIMKKFIRNYDPNNAPAILVPKAGHTRKGPRGIVSRSSKGIESVRQLLARDIMELRRVYPDIPNSQLRKLIKLNKQLYPEMRRR
ncbi:RHS repeat-associated protein [Anoxybacillus calidus]|uniref:RHS repeat-associated protein n=1 Tax=[Anoxybacillus] calidus TaxID=575178 RepID=A0A7W0BTS6_9BACL|nr:DNRLRE domain-containing protein [Anoxybacillus calidus]MBA2870486.1 RHS repeat-associated protein [Anoxybacillus calidus]